VPGGTKKEGCWGAGGKNRLPPQPLREINHSPQEKGSGRVLDWSYTNGVSCDCFVVFWGKGGGEKLPEGEDKKKRKKRKKKKGKRTKTKRTGSSVQKRKETTHSGSSSSKIKAKEKIDEKVCPANVVLERPRTFFTPGGYHGTDLREGVGLKKERNKPLRTIGSRK